MTFEGHFGDSPTDITLYAQLTRDLLVIAKFIVSKRDGIRPGKNYLIFEQKATRSTRLARRETEGGRWEGKS